MPPHRVPHEDQAALAEQETPGRERRPSRARFWIPVAIGGGIGSLPSLGAQVSPDDLSVAVDLAITLGGPTLGVLAGAIAYAITRRADREYESEVQRGRREIINALKGDPQRVGGLYYREDTDSFEIYRAGPQEAVGKPSGPPRPRRPIKPGQRPLQAVPDPAEDEREIAPRRIGRRSDGSPGRT
jgi:hypothetical protein